MTVTIRVEEGATETTYITDSLVDASDYLIMLINYRKDDEDD